MPGNTMGKMFTMTTFGESHGVALGVVMDGIPPRLEVNEDHLREWLIRRRPGGNPLVSPRFEKDEAEILSGVFEGKTLGTPLAVIVRNTNQKSSDYDELRHVYRKGHGDKTFQMKYGFRDHRGGGRSSGRETVARVIAGYFSSLIIPQVRVELNVLEIGHLKFEKGLNEKEYLADKFVQELIFECKEKGESVGGRIFVQVKNVPSSLGEPVFDKLKADLAKAMMSIGGVLSFQLLDGIEGGISSGEDIGFEVRVKAPSSVGAIAKKGRHDPCLIPRVLVVIESMVMFTLADHTLRQKVYEESH
jgi:chorismate synthase